VALLLRDLAYTVCLVWTLGVAGLAAAALARSARRQWAATQRLSRYALLAWFVTPLLLFGFGLSVWASRAADPHISSKAVALASVISFGLNLYTISVPALAVAFVLWLLARSRLRRRESA
jgi:hypothetical protein